MKIQRELYLKLPFFRLQMLEFWDNVLNARDGTIKKCKLLLFFSFLFFCFSYMCSTLVKLPFLFPIFFFFHFFPFFFFFLLAPALEHQLNPLLLLLFPGFSIGCFWAKLWSFIFSFFVLSSPFSHSFFSSSSFFSPSFIPFASTNIFLLPLSFLFFLILLFLFLFFFSSIFFSLFLCFSFLSSSSSP